MKKTENAYLRVDIVNLIVQGAKLSANADAGGFGSILGAQLAGELLEKIARRAWEIGDEEIKCHCYRLGLVEQSDELESWFEDAMKRMKKQQAKGAVK